MAMANHFIVSVHIQSTLGLSRRKMISNKDWAFNHHIRFQTEYYYLLNYILRSLHLYTQRYIGC